MNADTSKATPETASREAIAEALAAAEKVLAEAARRAEQRLRESEKLIRENLERLMSRAGRYGETAKTSMDEAQRVLVEQVNAQPVTATFIALGVGFVIGAVFASGRR